MCLLSYFLYILKQPSLLEVTFLYTDNLFYQPSFHCLDYVHWFNQAELYLLDQQEPEHILRNSHVHRYRDVVMQRYSSREI